MLRYASKADANQPELVKRWRTLGGSWFSTHRLKGELDGVAGLMGIIDVRVEIKDGSRKPSERRLTEKEREVFLNWRGRKPVIWETIEDVETTFAQMRVEAIEIKRHFDALRRERKSLEDTLDGITVEELLGGDHAE